MKFLFKKYKCIFLTLLLMGYGCASAQKQDFSHSYLDAVKQKLTEVWPKNKTINVIFHGHSVPSGYFKTPNVNTLAAYPHLTLLNIKQYYPYAVVNCITTSVGGEQAEQGAKRFATEVLNHHPDILFIDYALNDRSIGLERAKAAWEQMIQEALDYGTEVILLTPTPDLKEDILSDNAMLAKHSKQINELAKKYGVGLVDSYAIFKNLAKTEPLSSYMAQNNHINEKGHMLVANAIYEQYFKLNK